MIFIRYNGMKQLTTISCHLHFPDSVTQDEKLRAIINKMTGDSQGGILHVTAKDKYKLFKELIEIHDN